MNSVDVASVPSFASPRTESRSGGHSFSRGALYTLLGNPIYIGEVRHKGTRHPGQHQPIVERTVWEKSDQLLLVGRAANQ